MGISKIPTIYIFLGLPGSGKTHFSRILCEKLGLVRFNSDAMRMAIFGSREKTTEIYKNGDRKTLNSYVFNAIDYATGELLAKGQSVAQDANHNERSNRKNLEALAERHGGRVILIHIKTPREIAVQRAQERPETPEQRTLTPGEIENVYTRMLKNLDAPEESELVIEIDGTAHSNDQWESFKKQIEAFND
jgi:predicted kinase